MLMICLGYFVADAHIGPTDSNAPKPNKEKPTVNYREDCNPAERSTDQNINNVRAKLTTGGDVWWDLSDGRYIVPIPVPGDPEVSSIFAGSVWIGGFDSEGNLKLAAGQYRNGTRNDYYPGPLDPVTGKTDLPICKDWDRFYEVLGDDVRRATKIYDANPTSFPCDSVADDIRYYPGKGNPYWLEKFDFELPSTGQGLGSFWDEDADGLYDPCQGDFPLIDIRGCEPFNRKQAVELIPDQMIFWIYNDAGGPHTNSQGDEIQMEIQVQAFAYATNDEINDMTFQRYKLINRAQGDIGDCYFAMWVDPDLGCYTDDYVGCDVERSMAYVYNEDALDGTTGITCEGGVPTYEDEVPILGVDYFRGPLGPQLIVDNITQGNQHVIVKADDGYDEDLYSLGDTIFVRPITPADGPVQPDISIELGMSSFTYSNNGGVGNNPAGTTDPGVADEFYNYLTGRWRDGTNFTVGGSGYDPNSTDITSYAFPGLPSVDTEWSMCSAGLPFGDRRTIQASGPFLLQPGAINELIVGAVWVPNINYPCPDISKLQVADDLAQALFDNCFDITDGPDAPDVCSIELDREVVLVLTNDLVTSNNANLNYEEKDLLVPDGESDSLYVFEGYKIFQLVAGNVSPQELDDPDKAKLIRQVDLQNGVTDLHNWTGVLNPLNDERLWQSEEKVDGADQGLRTTFRVTEDAFASGADTKLVNHKEYHFMVLAYAYNNWKDWNVDATDSLYETGQRTPYLEGRGNISTYTLVPRPIIYSTLNSGYGDGPIVTRLQGEGAGDTFLEVVEGTYDAVLDGTLNGEVTYEQGQSPVDVKVYNPLEVKDAQFELELVGEKSGSSACTLRDGATWKMTDLGSGEVINSDVTIDELNEQLVVDYGFTVSISQTEDAGENTDNGVGAIGATLQYANNEQQSWYLGISDEGNSLGLQGPQRAFFNFLKTGSGEVDEKFDPDQDFTNFGNGFFYPFFLTDYLAPDPTSQFAVPYISPGYVEHNGGGFVRSGTRLKDLNNVDIVFTADKSKWSRCVVVETSYSAHRQADSDYEAEGNVTQFDLRDHNSVGKDGNDDGDGKGMGWFPGFAIDIETGKRLNIFFGENSMYDDKWIEFYDNGTAVGNDMLFNPTDQIVIDNEKDFSIFNWMTGGGHMVYVTRQEYDECAAIREDLGKGNPCNFICFDKNKALQQVTWTSAAMMAPDTEMLSIADGLIPNELTIKLRVQNNYNEERTHLYGVSENNAECETIEGLPKYRLDFSPTAAEDLTEDDYEGALENVNVVPNPYYAYSQYEISQFTNTVKITNLPANANVTIYSIDGKFIRQFKRNENPGAKPGSNPGVSNFQVFPDVEWDLENFAGIPVASGVYLIHIEAPDLQAERTIKWFGVHRKFDPTGL